MRLQDGWCKEVTKVKKGDPYIGLDWSLQDFHYIRYQRSLHNPALLMIRGGFLTYCLKAIRILDKGLVFDQGKP